ncbi:MAG: S1C family serine protease [Tagaea sp.]|nr:S1C family serine protease [Tagaea sp.]
MRLSFFAALAGALFLSACQQDVRQAPVLTPIAFHANVDQSRPFTLMGLEFNVRRGQDIGGYQNRYARGNSVCGMNSSRITWNRGRTASGLEWADRFYEVFRDMGYPVVGNPANPLERERERSRAEYVVVAQVTNIQLAICEHLNFWTAREMGYSGSAWMEVTWQVMSNAERRVVFEGKTEGTGVVEEPAHGGWEPMLLAAFEAAAHNLGASQGFHAVASGERAAQRSQEAALQAANRAAIRLTGPLPSRAPIQERMGAIRIAVPTIDMGDSHGSGVFITDNGYLLTNEHVVRERRQVTVRLQGGVEVLGDVVRTDVVRDIALVKVPVNRTPVVPIRAGGLQVGDDVYAVGTPLQARLAQTVTRGIVSALRNDPIRGSDRAQPLIQSDASIQGGNSGGGLFDRHGNLVGITVSTAVVPGSTASSGANFFIPIESALEVLQVIVEPQGRTTVR